MAEKKKKKAAAPRKKAAPPKEAAGINRADVLRVREGIKVRRETVKVARPARLEETAIAALDGAIADLDKLVGKE